jgi:hypothetical protein
MQENSFHDKDPSDFQRDGDSSAVSGDNASDKNSKDQLIISKSNLKKFVIGLIFTLVLVALYKSNGDDLRLNGAVDACNASISTGITLAANSKSLTFDGKGNKSYSGGEYATLVCILNNLDAPTTLLERMLRTSAIMGSQEQTWSGISSRWSYHPENGLDVYLQIIEE